MSSEPQSDKKRKSKPEEDGNKKQKADTPKKPTPPSPAPATTSSPSPAPSPSATKPDAIEQRLQIPGFEEIKDGVVWRDGALDLEQSVHRLAGFVDKYIKHTPQYYYELLSQIFNCKCFLKLENLQVFGDIYIRNCFGAIVGNYFNQKSRIKCEFYELRGLVIVMNPQDHEHHLLDGIALTALHLKFDVIIYVAPGNLSLLQCVQLHSCHQKGAKVIFHKGDIASCMVRAYKHAADMHMVFIEHKFTPQFSMIGAATVAYEMLHEATSLDTIVVPLRLYTVGWSYVSGISLYCKMVKPSMKVIVVQMTEDIALGDSAMIFKKDSDRLSLFPDRAEMGWLSLVQEKNILRNVFDAFDARNIGKFSVGDLENIITQIGGDPKRSPPQLQVNLSLTEFMKKIDLERLRMLNTMWEENKQFLDFLSLENLKAKKLIDEVVEVSEDQAVVAFIKCLEYTHTLTNGKGSIALAGLFSGKIQIRKDENLAILIMGGFVDVIDFQTLFDYGLDLIGQNFEIELDLPDNATALSNVLKVIGELKVSVYEILMDRSGEALRQYHVRTRVQCRSRNFEQQQDAVEAITKMGYRCKSSRNPSLAPSPKITPSPLSTSPLSASTSPIDIRTNNINNFMSSSPIIVSKPTGPVTTSSVPPLTPLSSSSSTHSAPPAASTTQSANSNGAADSKLYPAQPRKMESVNVDTIKEAHQRIKNNLNHTPVYLSQVFRYSKLCKCKLYLMLENIQKTGSFKIRGSSNMVLKALEESSTPPKGLVAASAGNHAQGVALVSNKVGLPCTIVCPEYAPESKLQWTRNYGAEVIKHGNSLEAAAKCAEQICEQRGWLMVRPFNDVDVIEGQGTMGCEIYNQIPDIDTVVVNVGGGGMIAGIALYLKGVNPNIRVVGVQSANVAPLADFKTTHTLRYIEPAMLTLADGTNVKLPGGVHTKILDELVDEYVTVSENEIASTIVHLMENSRTISEGAGCLGLAALLHHKISVRKDEKVCVVLCGGNIDMSTLKQVYEYGLRSLGRLFTIHVSTWDYPGNLAKIIALAAKAELVVREIRHIRGKGDINWNEVTISLAFYSNSFDHQVLFLNLLVEENLHPKVIGRKYIKEHETIYGSVDKAMINKKEEMQKKHQEHQEKFMDWYRQQYSTVM